ncbi:sensor histidine kinase [Nonomuraea thailandensis]|uniref:sensor histidine kinase n=1 Tax=Nonomuraea thailandensis TaxID=1188745 RepID=UPI0027E2FDA6|nr:histidine kinase [Nonomuraea thailandensis]
MPRRNPGPARPFASGLWAWLRARYTDAATWRALAYTIVLATAVPVLYGCLASLLLLAAAFLFSLSLVSGGTVALGFGQVSTAEEALPYTLAGLVILLAAPYLLALAAGGHAVMAAALLGTGPAHQLQARLVEVTRSRARLVSAFEAERRRIEGDLHDGAQQRLISLTLQLGLARHDLPSDSASARSVADAHDQAKQLMAELRELIHGIRPQILADSGLTEALRDLADQSPIPVRIESDLPGRLPDHIESTAYFAVSEALANALKHSDASAITVRARLRQDLLVMEVSDDGHGRADPRGGTGLTGLADRVAVLDGKLWLSSPPGGPARTGASTPRWPACAGCSPRARAPWRRREPVPGHCLLGGLLRGGARP